MSAVSAVSALTALTALIEALLGQEARAQPLR